MITAFRLIYGMRVFKCVLMLPLLMSVLLTGAADANGGNLGKYVNPRIGTAHCRWFHFAPGALPFGMAKPGPSTNGALGNKSGWEATGYDFRETSIDGFPNLHEFQIGGISLMPTRGKLITVAGDTADVYPQGYRSKFSHDNEVVAPGYYSVVLDDYAIKVELTATKRVAYHRYTFPKGNDSHILFDIGRRNGESGAVTDASVRMLEDGTIEGMVVTEPEYVKKYQPGADVRIYFSANVSKKPKAVGTFIGDKQFSGQKSVAGPGAGMYLTFDTESGEDITVKVGLSYTSIANARENLAVESDGLSFNQARAQSEELWEDMLGRIKVESTSDIDKTKFYTGLYHAILGRGIANDVNGAYPRHDGSIGQLPMKDGVPMHNMYNTDGVWGAQWNLVQLWALAYPDYLSDFVSSHLQIYKDSGWLGDGIAASKYVSGVGTNLLPVMIAAAYQSGIRDFDIATAYEACRKNELDGTDRPFGAGKLDTDQFLEYGFVPHKDTGEGMDEAFMFSASHTLEYSYSAWAVAQMAKSLGHEADYKRLMNLSKGWERIYDTTLGFVHPKNADGTFIDNFNPMDVWRGFQEGNAWQYTFYVPHDTQGLVEKVGKERFVERLDSIFSVSRDKIFSGGTDVWAFSGLQTVYNHGNQPCLHISWLFDAAGKPALTHKWVRAILDEFYGTDGVHGYGYGQDEDQGQLGAWYVISSIGLFDVGGLTASHPSMAIGSPKFNKVIVKLHPEYYQGKEFVIDAPGNSDRNIYVSGAKFNGMPMDNMRLPFDSIVSGGYLELEMSDNPKK